MQFFDMQLSQKLHLGLIMKVVRLPMSSYLALGKTFVTLDKTFDMIIDLLKWQNELFSVPVETEKAQTSSACTF